MSDYIADWMKRSPDKKKLNAGPAYEFGIPAGPGAVADNFMNDRPLSTGVTTPSAIVSPPQRGVIKDGEPWMAAIPETTEEVGAAGARAVAGRRAVAGFNAEVGAPGPEWNQRMNGLERASKLAAPDPVGAYNEHLRKVRENEVRMGIRAPDSMDPREAFLRTQVANGAIAPQYRDAAKRELDDRRRSSDSADREREAEALAINSAWKQDNYGNLTNTVTRETIKGPSQPVKLGVNEVLIDPETQKLIADNMEVVTKSGVKIKDLASMMKDTFFMPPEQKDKYFAAFNSAMDELRGSSAPIDTGKPVAPEVRIWQPKKK